MTLGTCRIYATMAAVHKESKKHVTYVALRTHRLQRQHVRR